MARAAKKQSVPPLVENENIPEIFATDVVGAGVIGGCISINLAAHRWSVPAQGKAPDIHRALVARLVLSREAALQLAQSLSNLSQAGREQGEQDKAGAKASAKN